MRIPQYEHRRLPIQRQAFPSSRLQLHIYRYEFFLEIIKFLRQTLPILTFKEVRVTCGYNTLF